MLDRLLAVSLKLIVTVLIALAGGAAVMTGYTGFIHLVRVHWATAGTLLGVAVGCGIAAYSLASRRGDLVDC